MSWTVGLAGSRRVTCDRSWHEGRFAGLVQQMCAFQKVQQKLLRLPQKIAKIGLLLEEVGLVVAFQVMTVHCQQT